MQVEPRKDFYSNSKGIQENERNWRRMASSFGVFLAIKGKRIRIRLYASPCLLGIKFWLPLPLNPLNAFPPCVVSPPQLLWRPTWGIEVPSIFVRESKVVQFQYSVDSKRIARAQKSEMILYWHIPVLQSASPLCLRVDSKSGYKDEVINYLVHLSFLPSGMNQVGTPNLGSTHKK